MKTRSQVPFCLGWFLALMAMSLIQFPAFGEARSRLTLTFDQLNDHTKMISAKLNVRRDRRYDLVPGAEIAFSLMSEGVEIVLGTAVTNENGVAAFYLSKDYPIPVNEDNYMIFRGSFEGSDSIGASNDELEVKKGNLVISFSEEDDNRTISIKLTELDTAGKEVPAPDEPVTLYVARLYSLLPIEEGTTGEDGLFEINFDHEIPGDSLGNLTLVARVVDSDIFGNVTATQSTQWGVPVSYEIKLPRALWSDQAPLWMIVGVVIVLGGVWINFFIAMWHVYRFANGTHAA